MEGEQNSLEKFISLNKLYPSNRTASSYRYSVHPWGVQTLDLLKLSGHTIVCRVASVDVRQSSVYFT